LEQTVVEAIAASSVENKLAERGRAFAIYRASFADITSE